MKLFTDTIYHPLSITESIDDFSKAKSLFIEGIFAQSEKENRNGRIYPKKVLEKAISRYNTEYVEPARALGELNHSDSFSVNPERACILIKSLDWKGNDVYGKAKVLEDLPMGKIVAGLIHNGVLLGVSTRGAGSLKESSNSKADIVDDDFMIGAIDVVSNPSGIDCWVKGINESVECIMEDGVVKTKPIQFQKSIDKSAAKIQKCISEKDFTSLKSEFMQFVDFIKKS